MKTTTQLKQIFISTLMILSTGVIASGNLPVDTQKNTVKATELAVETKEYEDLYREALEIYKDKQYVESYNKFRTLANEYNSAESKHYLAQMSRRGRGVGKNYEKAVRWYMDAAKQGYAPSQNVLALMYANGLGVKKDLKQAFEWQTKAAEQGFSESQYNLSQMYQKGQHTRLDHELSMKWLMAASKQNHVKSQVNLALMYSRGQGSERDLVKTKYWLERVLSSDDSHQKKLANYVYRLLGLDKY